jgi:hypothetical protein
MLDKPPTVVPFTCVLFGSIYSPIKRRPLIGVCRLSFVGEHEKSNRETIMMAIELFISIYLQLGLAEIKKGGQFLLLFGAKMMHFTLMNSVRKLLGHLGKSPRPFSSIDALILPLYCREAICMHMVKSRKNRPGLSVPIAIRLAA